METFKHCRTNVQICERVDDIPFAVYQSEDNPNAHGKLQQLICNLRALGVLCTKAGSELWVFGNIVEDAKAALEGFSLRAEHTEEGELETDIIEAVDGRPAREILLDAIQGSISFRFAQACGIVRVGDWTWVCVNGGDEDVEGAILLRLHVKANENGSLYATTVVEKVALVSVPVDSASKAMSMRLAPSGVTATVLDEGQGSADLISGDAWEALVTAELAMEGIKVSDQATWLSLTHACDESTANFTWPAQLCFTPSIPRQSYEAKGGDAGWKHLFLPPEHSDGFKDPLTFAEDWFRGKEDRETALVQASAPVLDSGASLDGGTSAGTSGEMEGVVATSSPFVLRVADQQAAMTGIYPTPEDNLMPPHASQQEQQHPQSEAAATSVTADANGIGADAMHAGDMPGAPRNTSSSDGPTFQPMHDDLFDDMGNDMGFGGGEVGDADFDFFNEDVEAAPETAIEDVPMINDAQESAGVDDIISGRSRPSEAVTGASKSIADQQAESKASVDETVLSSEPVSLDYAVSSTPQGASPAATDPVQDQPMQEPEKPLSPFGIKERLLPPPIPASARSNVNNGAYHKTRRSSAFDPVPFKEGLDLTSSYTHSSLRSPVFEHRPSGHNDISLPPKRKKSRPKVPIIDPVSDVSESEEDSFTTATSVSDDEAIPKPSWSPHKRKRNDVDGLGSGDHSFWPHEDIETPARESTQENLVATLTQLSRSGNSFTAPNDGSIVARDHMSTATNASSAPDLDLPSIQNITDLTKLDLVYVAQLVSEQAVSCFPRLDQDLDIMTAASDEDQSARCSALEHLAEQLLGTCLPDAAACDIANLALIREAQAARAASSQPTRPGLPRPPPQRNDTNASGPDTVPLAPPYIRVQRGHDTYEMLPPALEFWETLSLAPCNGPKHIRAFCVFPDNEDFQALTNAFMRELGGAYESCKLGSHVHNPHDNEDDGFDDFELGQAPVKVEDESNVTLEAAFRAYRHTCIELGTFLARIGHLDTERDRTIVIYILNVFSHHPEASHHLCTCFWLLYKAYRDNLPKTARNAPKCDIVLQILPVGLVASADTLICLDSKQLGALAKEVYDRCPPGSTNDQGMNSALPNYAAPFVEIAAPPPKRIGFQLSAEPPSDLLHEASTLHLAYAPSQDGKWLTASWVDNTGRYASSTSFCLCGRIFADVAEDIWDRTRDILAAREVTWRIIIVTTSKVSDSSKSCWRKTISKPRKQPYSVTLLTADLNPDLKLSLQTQQTISDDPSALANSSSAAFLTPVSTPSSQALQTVSPDTNPNITSSAAPPTPAPSDSYATAAAALESDPDAHLVDLTDETFSVLFNPSYTSATSTSPGTLASGALYKRGRAEGQCWESMKMDLLFTVQVRPNGTVDEGGVRHAEMTLREVARGFRGLSVLSRAKGLHGGRSGGGGIGMGCMPVHLASAVLGSRGLDGFLG